MPAYVLMNPPAPENFPPNSLRPQVKDHTRVRETNLLEGHTFRTFSQGEKEAWPIKPSMTRSPLHGTPAAAKAPNCRMFRFHSSPGPLLRALWRSRVRKLIINLTPTIGPKISGHVLRRGKSVLHGGNLNKITFNLK